MTDSNVTVADWDTSSGAQTLSDIVDWVAKDIFSSQPHTQSDMLLSLDDILHEDAFADPLVDDGVALPQHDSVDIHITSCSPAALHRPRSPAPTEADARSGNPKEAKREQSPPERIVRPSKESCRDLLIVFPNLPPSGAKSRVETQIRTEIVLTSLPAAYSSPQISSWDSIASWKWLRLPKGSSTKKRLRKDVRISPLQEDVLDLSVDVVCVSNPDVLINSCESCQQREAKRTARKIAARVRPAKSEVVDDIASDGEAKIVQFNCPELVDFSTGTCALPVRITCYCRHHREKVGFSVIFTLRDIDGHVVGTGSTPPIMITDDHKSASLAKNKEAQQQNGHQQSPSAEEGGIIEGAVRGLQRHDIKKRPAKPYDRKPRVASGSANGMTPISTAFLTAPPSPSASPSQTNGYASPIDSTLFSALSSASTSLQQSFAPIPGTAFVPPSSSGTPKRSPSPSTATYPFPLLFGLPPPLSSFSSQAPPKIHRLIPASGPTHGGVEITVLGSNFSSATLSVVFGGTRATSTQKWSDNTLVCLLPPRATPGQVIVTVERVDDGVVSEEHDSTASNVFTYVDNSDRALMELALQVVGLKMTGKIEEAKNVALRIVSSTGNGTGMENEANGMTTLSADAPDPRLLLLQLGRIADLQGAIINLLSSYFPVSEMSGTSSTRNPLSYKAATGQTLLHLATILNLAGLVRWLIARGIEFDAQDHNGFTALHFAVLAGARDCATELVRAGADGSRRTHSGLTPAQLAGDWVSHLLVTPSREASVSSEEPDNSYDDEDDEDDITSFSDSSPTVVPQSPTPSSITRRRRPRVTSGSESSEGEHGEDTGVADDPPTPPHPGEDEKQLAFAGWLGRKLAAHLQPPQGPWGWTGALQQIPVFYVPVPGWPWSPPAGDEKHSQPQPTGEKAPPMPSSWEKWAAQMLVSPRMAFTQPAQPEADAEHPPQHTYPPAPAAPATAAERPRIHARFARSLGYAPAPVGEAEINSFGTLEVKARRRAKQDRMLLWFWLPILLLGLAWVLYTGVFVAYGTVHRSIRAILPLQDVLPLRQ